MNDKSDLTVDPGVTSIFARIEDFPAGSLHVNGKLGHNAGEAEVTSTGGAIGRVELKSITRGGDDPGSFTLIADDLRLRTVEWDIDGDTRYEGSPRNVFLDGSVGHLQLDVDANSALHVSTNGAASLEQFAFRIPLWSWNPVNIDEWGTLQISGCLRLFGGDMDVHFPRLGPMIGAGDLYTLAKGKEWGDC